MAQLKLFFLGSPRIDHNGDVLDMGASKPLALLVYLAVTGQRHSRDSLGAMLWPESEQGRAYLRHALWTLKKELGERWLYSSRDQIAFKSDDDVWLDVDVFQAAIAATTGSEQPAGQMLAEHRQQLEEAVGLYENSFLAGFSLPDAPAFNEWQFFQGEALRQQLAGALERLAEECSARGEYDVAVKHARRWLALDPLHEPVHRTLMRLYALAGQQAAALRQYEECVRLLDVELGVEPEAETTALYEAIRTRQFEPASRDEAGQLLLPPSTAERYLFEGLLETGSHGEVFLGRDRQAGRPVIIKRLRLDAVERNQGLVARFVQEGELLSQLNHPNIVRMLATFEYEGRHHIVMEHVRGGSLAQRLREEPQLALDDVLAIGLELADALSRAHHLHIHHRDLKPENVLLAADGTPRLTDFGVARLLQREGRLTEAGALVGSPAYMSPEALQGAEPDERADIWSFGVLLFEMLAGRRPFVAEQLTPLIVVILTEPLPDILQFRPDVPPALVALLQRMLVKEPQARLASMRLVAAELEAIRKGRSGVASVEVGAARLAPQSDVGTATPLPSPVAPFVAREQEMARLEAMLETALTGQLRVAFVLGEAGQGKTALLSAFARRAQQRNPTLLVVGGNCNAYTGLGDPYLPFREILGALTADLEAWSQSGALQPEHGRRIRRLLPETGRLLVETAPDLVDTFVPLSGLLERTASSELKGETWRQQLLARASNSSTAVAVDLQQYALLDQYARLLQALARRAPLLLLLDDLQWADPASVSLLFYLGRRLSDCPAMIVGAYRPAEVAQGQDGEPHPLSRVVSELQRLFGEITIDLAQAEGVAFINGWLDEEPNRLPSFFRQILYRQTGGHPLFTIELLRAMQARGDLRQDDQGVWEVQTNINWNTMPARVEGAIAERIQRLQPAMQELLQVASVEGEEFTAEVVAQSLLLDERETVRLLSRELDKVHALVQAIGSRRSGTRRLSRYRFRHILIQRYLYNSLDDVERTYQHEAVGSALEMVHAEQPAEVAVQLARHFEIAEVADKAAGYLQMAGDQARRTAALSEATRFYRSALSHLPEGERAVRAGLLRKLGECQWMTGRARDALETFTAGYDLFRELDNLQEAGAMQRLIGRVYWEVGDREQSLHHYHQSLSILEQLEDSVELAWAISSISQMHMLAGEYQPAIDWGERALRLAHSLSVEAVIVHALNNVGSSYLNRGEIEQGREMLQESVRRALEDNLPHDACRGRLNLGEGLASWDYYEEARAEFETLHEYAERVHTTLYAGSSLVELARIEWLTGHWRASLQRRQLIEEWLERGQSLAYVHVIASTVFGQQHNDLGQSAAARDTLQRTLATVRSFDELQLAGPHLSQLLRALAATGEMAQARQVAEELLAAVTRASYQRRFSLQPLLVICDALPLEVMEPLLGGIRVALANLEEDNTVDAVPSQKAIRAETWGTLALRQGNYREATNWLQQAVAAWQKVERPYDQARALKKLGEALLRSGNEARAQATFARSDALIQALEANLDDEQAKEGFLRSALVQEIQLSLPAARRPR